ncbi:aspartate/glutamate racemase family protein [Sulfurimonas sp.]|uniref:aspartate/glutamate racemase family protein n=1 Tax=Sulfurimonas sp. TaxID=2022749 RepID=UPI003D11A23C
MEQKTIGLLGGMSWESTLEYYKNINQGINKKLGKHHSAKIAMVSVDFEPIEVLQSSGIWEDETAKILSKAAKQIEAANADFLLICTNTMHKVLPQIEQNINIPILHIADAAAEAILKDGLKKVGLLGTAFTMEQEFYKERLQSHGLEVVVPQKEDREIVHKVIYDELCLGITKESSKKEYIKIINFLAQEGCEGIILGCTEIGLLVQQEDVDVKLYDTAAIYANKAVEMALG